MRRGAPKIHKYFKKNPYTQVYGNIFYLFLYFRSNSCDSVALFCVLFCMVFCMIFTMRARIADNFSTMFSTMLTQGGGQIVPLLIFAYNFGYALADERYRLRSQINSLSHRFCICLHSGNIAVLQKQDLRHIHKKSSNPSEPLLTLCLNPSHLRQKLYQDEPRNVSPPTSISRTSELQCASETSPLEPHQ